MMNPDEFLKICYERSRTMGQYREKGGMTLGEFAALQAEKVRRNRGIAPILNPGDFYARVEEFTAERLGKEAAKKVADAVRLGTVLTADHHGGIFCAQTFQSDLLYGMILKELGSETGVIPVMSGGQVELDSSTYARGLCLYTEKNRKERIPFFSSRPAARTAYSAPAVDREMIKRFYSMLSDCSLSEDKKKEISELVRVVYETEDVLSCVSFESQVTKIGASLSEKLFGKDGAFLAYLEAERLSAPLIAKELREKNTPLSKLFTDEKALSLMKSERLSDGAPITDILFKAPDKKGRKVNLRLTDGAKLCGRAWEGNEISFPADADSLAGLLEDGSLIPGFFLIACACFFERGVTWMGGVFQTEYLPEWKRSFSNLLIGLGMDSEADRVEKYDCSAYVCGPMFALYGGDDYANPAGPAEFWIRRRELGKLDEMMQKTKLGDAHFIGLSEMYVDLTHPDERSDGWYEIIGRELRQRFPENVL